MPRNRIQNGGFIRLAEAYFPAWMLDNGYIPKPDGDEVNIILVVVCDKTGKAFTEPLEIVLVTESSNENAVTEWTRITGPEVLDLTELDDLDGI